MQNQTFERTLTIGGRSTTLLHRIFDQYHFEEGCAVLINNRKQNKGEIWFYDNYLNFKWKAEYPNIESPMGYLTLWKSDEGELWGNDSLNLMAKISLEDGAVLETHPYA